MSARHSIIAFSIIAATVGCGERASPPAEEAAGPGVTATAPTPLLARLSDDQAEGRVLFQSVCWTCHGNSGRGDGPAVQAGATGQPPDFIADGYANLSVDELESRFEAALSGQGADPEHPHMQYVVNLLRPERFRTALSYVPVLAYPPGIPGSALAGMDLYETRCTGCHGEDGDGAGYAAAALVTVKPADFRTDTLVAAGDYQGLFQRIREGGRSVHGSSMPAWGVALSDTEIWDLVAYVATFRENGLPPLPVGSR
jgi:cytochrome c oxidase cbb3-type subunit III